MKVLVTGATGFIGRRVVSRLCQAYGPANITSLTFDTAASLLERTGRENLARLGVKSVFVDLLTRSTLGEVPRSPDLVVHLASCTDMGQPDHSINDVGTRHLIESIEPLPSSMHFVYASSISTSDYRDNLDVPVTEETLPDAACYNEYGRSKLRTVDYLTTLALRHGFALSIVRVSAVHGEGSRRGGLFDTVERPSWLASMLLRLNWPGKISIAHVDDVASLFVELSRRPRLLGNPQEVIAAVESPTLGEMAEAVSAAKGRKRATIVLPTACWNAVRTMARLRPHLERVLPHGLYNRLWQGFSLVNNQFWNESRHLAKFDCARSFHTYHADCASRLRPAAPPIPRHQP